MKGKTHQAPFMLQNVGGAITRAMVSHSKRAQKQSAGACDSTEIYELRLLVIACDEL
jgi:hypothetical protein